MHKQQPTKIKILDDSDHVSPGPNVLNHVCKETTLIDVCAHHNELINMANFYIALPYIELTVSMHLLRLVC